MKSRIFVFDIICDQSSKYEIIKTFLVQSLTFPIRSLCAIAKENAVSRFMIASQPLITLSRLIDLRVELIKVESVRTAHFNQASTWNRTHPVKKNSTRLKRFPTASLPHHRFISPKSYALAFFFLASLLPSASVLTTTSVSDTWWLTAT